MKALIIGATGLVGREIVNQTIADSRFNEVVSFSRRETGVRHPKYTEHIVDFKTPEVWKKWIQGDVAFSALGTTRSQAGSLEAQYEVDFTYQANFAKACAENGVKSFVLISSGGADSKFKVPYIRMKADLEAFVKSLHFQSLQILRPGPLQGHREHRRPTEELLAPVMKALSILPFLKSMSPVSGKQVAATAIRAAFLPTEVKIWEPFEVLSTSSQNQS